jgi:hypothetical protein
MSFAKHVFVSTDEKQRRRRITVCMLRALIERGFEPTGSDILWLKCEQAALFYPHAILIMQVTTIDGTSTHDVTFRLGHVESERQQPLWELSTPDRRALGMLDSGVTFPLAIQESLLRGNPAGSIVVPANEIARDRFVWILLRGFNNDRDSLETIAIVSRDEFIPSNPVIHARGATDDWQSDQKVIEIQYHPSSASIVDSDEKVIAFMFIEFEQTHPLHTPVRKNNLY